MHKTNPFTKYFTKEQSLQYSICEYMDYQYPNVLYFHPMNEGKRTAFEQCVCKKLGLKPGVPDLIILEPRIIKDQIYHGLMVELKASANPSLTAYQKEWKEKLEARNYKFLLINSFVQFQISLKNYLNL